MFFYLSPKPVWRIFILDVIMLRASLVSFLLVDFHDLTISVGVNSMSTMYGCLDAYSFRDTRLDGESMTMMVF